MVHHIMEDQSGVQRLSELLSSKPMKKVIKLLVSLSLFPIIFSYKLWCSHPILALPIQLLSHALDKNYIFLVCNGILVLLAKTSGPMVRSRPCSYDLIDDDDDNDDDHLHTPPPHAKSLDYSLLHKEEADDLAECGVGVLLKNADPEYDREEEEEEKHVIEEAKGEKEEDSRSLTMMIVEVDYFRSYDSIMEEEDDDEDCDEDDEELDNGVFVEEEKEVVEERERLNKLSTEELNKKFEEFIRKMKEDIRIEAQQQHLVLVK